jgi:hypothetical protein
MTEEFTFTPDELIAALTAARAGVAEDDPAALTMRELSAATGKSSVYLARLLEGMIAVGDIECVRKPWTRIDGMVTTVPAYRLRRGGVRLATD